MAAKNNGERTFEWSDPSVIGGIFLAILAAIWAAWAFGHTQIATFYVYARYVELWPIWVIGRLTGLPGFAETNRWMARVCHPDSVFSLCHRDFSTIAWSDIGDSSAIVNGILLAILSWQTFKVVRYLLKSHPGYLYTRKHNIKSFVEENKKLYPHLRMFSELDLINEPLDHPVFGMSQTSRQFVYEHGLIVGWQAEADGTFTPTLDREKTTLLMRQQLGKLWTKSTDLSIPETLILSIVLPRVAATDSSMNDAKFKEATGDCDRMLKWCWDQFVPPPRNGRKKGAKGGQEEDPYAWLKPDIDVTEPRKMIQKWIGHPSNSAIIQKHAYNATVLFRFLLEAQRLGVLQPAEMRWMRFYHRPMWYLLENYGRSTGYAEGVAVMGHYLYEIKQGEAIVDPQLDKVVNGIESAMTAFRYEKKDVERYEALQRKKAAKAASAEAAIGEPVPG